VIKPLVLVTRPQPEADATATRVAALGYRTLIEPLIEIVPRPGPPLELGDIQAVLVTSGNGARALAAHTPVRDQWLFSVGDATAKALRELGFLRVESAAAAQPSWQSWYSDDATPTEARSCTCEGMWWRPTRPCP